MAVKRQRKKSNQPRTSANAMTVLAKMASAPNVASEVVIATANAVAAAAVVAAEEAIAMSVAKALQSAAKKLNGATSVAITTKLEHRVRMAAIAVVASATSDLDSAASVVSDAIAPLSTKLPMLKMSVPIHQIQALQKHATNHAQSAHLAVKAVANVVKVDASAVSVATTVDVKMALAKMQPVWAMRKLKCPSIPTPLQRAPLK